MSKNDSDEIVLKIKNEDEAKKAVKSLFLKLLYEDNEFKKEFKSILYQLLEKEPFNEIPQDSKESTKSDKGQQNSELLRLKNELEKCKNEKIAAEDFRAAACEEADKYKKKQAAIYKALQDEYEACKDESEQLVKQLKVAQKNISMLESKLEASNNNLKLATQEISELKKFEREYNKIDMALKAYVRLPNIFKENCASCIKAETAECLLVCSGSINNIHYYCDSVSNAYGEYIKHCEGFKELEATARKVNNVLAFMIHAYNSQYDEERLRLLEVNIGDEYDGAEMFLKASENNQGNISLILLQGYCRKIAEDEWTTEQKSIVKI